MLATRRFGALLFFPVGCRHGSSPVAGWPFSMRGRDPAPVSGWPFSMRGRDPAPTVRSRPK
eukprot:4555228-Pyramimonas_sp.AAC.1